jgi:hypothetical protein
MTHQQVKKSHFSKSPNSCRKPKLKKKNFSKKSLSPFGQFGHGGGHVVENILRIVEIYLGLVGCPPQVGYLGVKRLHKYFREIEIEDMARPNSFLVRGRCSPM